VETSEKGGTFLMVNVAAQRARQIMQGAPPLAPASSRKPAAIAIREVEDGLVPFYMPGDLPMLETPAEETAEETAPEDTEAEEVDEPSE
jgi:DNA-directed RNA polymerase omega subunit